MSALTKEAVEIGPELSFQQRYRTLLAVSEAIVAHRDVATLFPELACRVRQVVRFDYMILVLHEAATNTMRLHVAGTPEHALLTPESVLPVEDDPAGLVWQTQRPLIISRLDELKRWPRLLEHVQPYGVQSLCWLPLTTARQRLGTLVFSCKQPAAYDGADMDFLQLVANPVAVAVENALAFQECKRAEEQACKILDAIPMKIVSGTVDGKLDYCNSRWRAYTGLTLEEVRGDAWERMIHPDDVERVWAAWRESVATGKTYEQEERQRRFDGVYRWFLAQVVPQRDADGRIERWYGASTDIEERNRAEDALRASEERFRLLFEKSLDAILVADDQGHFLAANAAACQLLGYSRDQLLTMKMADLRVLGDPPAGDRYRDYVPKGEEVGEFEFARPDAQKRIAEYAAARFAPGQHLCILRDVTQRRQAERELASLRDKLQQEKAYLEEEVRAEHFGEMVAVSAALRGALRKVETVAPTDATVLLRGETGTGKELVALALHDLSPRRERAFVKLNCAAIPTGLLESELFGHEKGAFTGAIAQRVGRFELADRGTLFLDEVGDIPLELQPKLLRVLQEQEFERLGGTRTLQVDVRLVDATHRDLAAMVAEGRFREDLYYRLSVFPVVLPPLRERPDGIPHLVRHFTQQFARRMGKRIEAIPAAVMEALVRYPWPGNVRELQNVIERAVILSPGPALQVPLADLHPVGRQAPAAVTLADAEREHILGALRRTRWVVGGPKGAAARLGVKRATLQRKMRRLGIARPA